MTTRDDPTRSDAPMVIVPVELPAPRRRARPVLAAGLGVAGALAALTGCGPTSSAPPPTTSYVPPFTTPPTTTPPPATTTTTRTTTTTTTTPDDDSGGADGGSSSGGYTGRDRLTQPCLPTRIPRGYVCTCNCVPD